jgi:uncharacterized protein (TIGR03083 family)
MTKEILMTNAPSPEAHAAYRGVRDRVIEVARGADRGAPCPLTPEWSVGDTLAHLVGAPADVLAGNLEGVASDAWTAAQVSSRADRSIDELIAEWDSTADAFEEILLAAPTIVSGQVVFDAMTHEHDLRHALGAFGAQDSDAIEIAAGWIANAAKGRKTEMEPAVEIAFGTRSVHWGLGDAVARVALGEFEFVRFSSGRRSEGQIRAAGYPSVESALSSPIFSPAEFDVTEPA